MNETHAIMLAVGLLFLVLTVHFYIHEHWRSARGKSKEEDIKEVQARYAEVNDHEGYKEVYHVCPSCGGIFGSRTHSTG